MAWRRSTYHHNNPLRSRRSYLVSRSFLILVISTVLVGGFTPPPAAAGKLTMVQDTSLDEVRTKNSSYTATGISIAAAQLPAGTYLVLWGGMLRSQSNTSTAKLQLTRGSTEIAYKARRTVASDSAGGSWLGSLSGSEALALSMASGNGTDYAYGAGLFIRAIRLDDKLTADSDYYTTGPQESNADEVTNAPITGWTTVKSLTRTFHATGTQNYIVLASMETSGDSSTLGCNAQLLVDGTAISQTANDGDGTIVGINNYFVADLASLGSGSKTISLQGQSSSSATCDFMRSRIYVLRASIFDQVLENESLGSTVTPSTGTTDKVSLTYTPNQPETVLTLYSMIGSDSTGGGDDIDLGLYNSNDAAQYYHASKVFGGAGQRQWMLGSTSQYLGATTTMKGQISALSYNDGAEASDARLIMWSMTLSQSYLAQANYRWFTNANSAVPGTPLAAQDSKATILPQTPFRLRQRLATNGAALGQGAGFKLQYAERVGSCDAGFSGEIYADVYQPASSSSQAKSPMTGYRVGASGADWFNPSAIDRLSPLSSQGSATAVGANTKYLYSKTHDFSIPSNATINGIVATITIPGGSIPVLGKASTIRLLNNGTMVGNNKATTTTYAYDTTYTYGGTTDLWGATWTPTDINDPDFGLAFQATLNAFNGMIIDRIQLTVYYSISAGSTLIQYYDNSGVADGAAISSSGSDPTNASRSASYRTYQESDPLINAGEIADGSDGMWDIALTSTAATLGKTYCLRLVKDTGGLLATYSQIPEITFAQPGPTLDQQMRGGASVLDGTKTDLVW